MNCRKPKTTNLPRGNRPTARSQIVSTLTSEILAKSSPESFLLGSEYQLCRRFGVSRVTVRLALDDLRNHGLVYRKHGVGTFAHGQSSRVNRHIGVLFKAPISSANRAVSEILNGALAFLRSLNSTLILIGQPPRCWTAELTAVLAGVIILRGNASIEDLTNLKNRGLPFLILDEPDLPAFDLEDNPSSELLFTAGERAAKTLHEAFLFGTSLYQTPEPIPNRSI